MGVKTYETRLGNMMKFDIFDFRFVESYYELFTIGDFLDVLEKQLSAVIKKEHESFNDKIRKKNHDLDDIELDEIRQNMYRLVDELLPRYFRSPFLVTLWAVTESAIIEVSYYLQQQKKQSLSIKDIRGTNFLDRAKKYFSHILNFPLFNDQEVWNRLDMLRTFRNIIAHGNGRIEAIKSKEDLRNIKRWSKNNYGVTITISNIIFSEKFLQETYTIVSSGLFDLLDRAKAAYSVK